MKEKYQKNFRSQSLRFAGDGLYLIREIPHNGVIGDTAVVK